MGDLGMREHVLDQHISEAESLDFGRASLVILLNQRLQFQPVAL